MHMRVLAIVLALLVYGSGGEPFVARGYLLDRLSLANTTIQAHPGIPTVGDVLSPGAASFGYEVYNFIPGARHLSPTGNAKAAAFLSALPASRAMLEVEVLLNETQSDVFDVLSVFTYLGNVGSRITVRGIITDRLSLDSVFGTDGANMITSPELHSPCTTTACMRGGYAVVVPSSSNYYGLVYNFTFTGNALVLQALGNALTDTNMTAVVDATVTSLGLIGNVTVRITGMEAPPVALTTSETSVALRAALGNTFFGAGDLLTWRAATGGLLCGMANGSATNFDCDFSSVLPALSVTLNMSSMPATVVNFAARSQSLLGTLVLSSLLGRSEIDVPGNFLSGTFFDIGLTSKTPRSVNVSGNALSGSAQLFTFPTDFVSMDVSGNLLSGGVIDANDVPISGTLILDSVYSGRWNSFPEILYECGGPHGEVHFRTMTPGGTHGAPYVLPAGNTLPPHCINCTSGAIYNMASDTCAHISGATMDPVTIAMTPVPPTLVVTVESLSGSNYCDRACGAAVAIMILFVIGTIVLAALVKKYCTTKKEKPSVQESGDAEEMSKMTHAGSAPYAVNVPPTISEEPREPEKAPGTANQL